MVSSTLNPGLQDVLPQNVVTTCLDFTLPERMQASVCAKWPPKLFPKKRGVRVDVSVSEEPVGAELGAKPFRMCMFVPIDAYLSFSLRRPSRPSVSTLQPLSFSCSFLIVSTFNLVRRYLINFHDVSAPHAQRKNRTAIRIDVAKKCLFA